MGLKFEAVTACLGRQEREQRLEPTSLGLETRLLTELWYQAGGLPQVAQVHAQAAGLADLAPENFTAQMLRNRIVMSRAFLAIGFMKTPKMDRTVWPNPTAEHFAEVAILKTQLVQGSLSLVALAPTPEERFWAQNITFAAIGGFFAGFGT